MCTQPKQFQDNLVACRTCDACLKSRKNTWIARAMAERAVAGQTLAITMSYANLPSGEKPLGARVFRYKDVQNWIKSVREAYFRQYGVRGELRYVICGERGSKKTQRLHWHCLLFTDQPLTDVGEWHHFASGNKVAKGHLPLERNLTWSLWPHGHVMLQEPAGKGVRYVFEYSMMEQFTAEKSKGQARFTRSHNHAASMFRMSKQPPIGVRYLHKRLAHLQEIGAVPTSLNVRVPDYGGYWYLSGDIRKWFIDELHQLNERIKRTTGKEAPQWASLIASVSKPDDIEAGEVNNDLEGLIYGTIKKAEWSEELDAFATAQLQRSIDTKNRGAHSGGIAKRCGGVRPCQLCEVEHSFENSKALYEEELKWLSYYLQRHPRKQSESGEQVKARFDAWWLGRGRASRGCLLRETPEVSRALKAYKGLYRLNKNAKGKQTIARGSKEA